MLAQVNEPVTVTRKLCDYEHHYEGPAGRVVQTGRCRVRICCDGAFPVPVVIATDLNESRSFTLADMTEWVAAEILLAHWHDRAWRPGIAFLWIEHHPASCCSAETFVSMVFPDYRLVDSTWDGLGEMIEDAKRAWFESMIEHGKPIPEPRPVEEQFSGRLVLRLPKSLHRRAVIAADRDGVSLNTLIVTAVSAATAHATRR